MARTPKGPKQVETLTHEEARRLNIPTAELQSTAEYMEEQDPLPPVAYSRARPLAAGEVRERDGDLDPQIVWNGVSISLTKAQVEQLSQAGRIEIGDAQLVWRGKDRQDWSDLVVTAPPLYIQEKVHPKAIIDDLTRRSATAREAASDAPDLFADFNGLSDPEARTEFYQHDQHWSNRMILGDSLQVMASLAEREGLRGQVQCIYFDPPYGIKFNSNWQVSTQNREVKDGKQSDVSREPEQVKAFRDTWKDGIHSYLTYLRDRLTIMRDMLSESGSIFLQISDENVHRIRSLLDEIFGEDNFAGLIYFLKTTGKGSKFVDSSGDYIVWYAKNAKAAKVRPAYKFRTAQTLEEQYNMASIENSTYRRLSRDELRSPSLIPQDHRRFMPSSIYSDSGGQTTSFDYEFEGRLFRSLPGYFWRTTKGGLDRLDRASRLCSVGNYIRYRMYGDDYPVVKITNYWDDVRAGGFGEAKVYVVQTTADVVQRCVLMASDPGDLVLDPTCGSGTTAFVAEQWGRRWITIDTSRVALALARTRLMSARYPYYYLADSPPGRQKEAEVSGKLQPEAPTHEDIRQGFVYERAPHITLKAIANNAIIDVIWDAWQAKLEPLLDKLNRAIGKSWTEREVPREVGGSWSAAAKSAHAAWWEARIVRQQEIDGSIARAADFEYLYDRPYADASRVRVAGPFTIESLSPHRVVPADEQDLVEDLDAAEGRRRRMGLAATPTDFAEMVLEHLKTAGVQQAAKADRITFTELTPWPGEYIGARGRFLEGEVERTAAIFIGPEFGTLGRGDLVAAAREATEARFDVLIACAFNFDAHASELTRLGPLPILKARMNPDLHMAGELKNTGKGNLFTVFGEPDIDIEDAGGGQIQVRVKGIDVYDPNTGEVRSNDVKGIAAWFIDTDYNHESFFVRHAYFLGANDPYKALKTALKAEIDEDAWATLYRDVSRPFTRPRTGKVAVKVINHFGDEVMKVFGV